VDNVPNAPEGLH
jgi:hypothetical protein